MPFFIIYLSNIPLLLKCFFFIYCFFFVSVIHNWYPVNFIRPCCDFSTTNNDNKADLDQLSLTNMNCCICLIICLFYGTSKKENRIQKQHCNATFLHNHLPRTQHLRHTKSLNLNLHVCFCKHTSIICRGMYFPFCHQKTFFYSRKLLLFPRRHRWSIITDKF